MGVAHPVRLDHHLEVRDGLEVVAGRRLVGVEVHHHRRPTVPGLDGQLRLDAHLGGAGVLHDPLRVPDHGQPHPLAAGIAASVIAATAAARPYQPPLVIGRLSAVETVRRPTAIVSTDPRRVVVNSDTTEHRLAARRRIDGEVVPVARMLLAVVGLRAHLLSSRVTSDEQDHPDRNGQHSHGRNLAPNIKRPFAPASSSMIVMRFPGRHAGRTAPFDRSYRC